MIIDDARITKIALQGGAAVDEEILLSGGRVLRLTAPAAETGTAADAVVGVIIITDNGVTVGGEINGSGDGGTDEDEGDEEQAGEAPAGGQEETPSAEPPDLTDGTGAKPRYSDA
jgi:hypothetical protein